MPRNTDTLFESHPRHRPLRSVSGKDYELTSLIAEEHLPRHVQFVWQGVNDRANLRQFLASNIRWGELDVRWDPHNTDLILRSDDFREYPAREDERWEPFTDIAESFIRQGRSLQIDLREGGNCVDAAIDVLEKFGIREEHLWFKGELHCLEEKGIRLLAAAFPGARLQCSIDFLAPMFQASPEQARKFLDRLASWGVNRFGLNWALAKRRIILEPVQGWGYKIGLEGIPDLEAFLQATLLLPDSIASDFNFPQWCYYGQGAGGKSQKYHYQVSRGASLVIEPKADFYHG